MLDLFKPMAKPQRRNLRFEVGILAAGDLQLIDFGIRRLEAGFKLRVHGAHICPVAAQLIQRIQIKAGIALCALEGIAQAVDGGLAGKAGKAADRAVYNIHPGLGGHEVSGNLVAGGIVRVQMYRDGQFVLQGLDQLFRGKGLQKAAHILDGKHMGAAVL